MGQRGRPPHPDILTPRQWEVLGLVRAGLTDEQIAVRLELTLAGAKYHVSEILTKLGVSSREDAAAWSPDMVKTRRWQWLVAPLAAAFAVAALAGVGVLAWGVLQADEETDASPAGFEDLDLPPPVTEPWLTREQALVKAAWRARNIQPVVAADAEASTLDAMALATRGAFGQAGDASTGWVVRFIGIADQWGGSQPCCTQASRVPRCRMVGVWLEDETSPEVPLGGAVETLVTDVEPAPTATDCTWPVSRAAAIVVAANDLLGDSGDVLPELISAEWLSADDAVERVQGFGPSRSTVLLFASNVDEGWFVTFVGRFPVIDPREASPGAPECQIAHALIAELGIVLFSNYTPSSLCS